MKTESKHKLSPYQVAQIRAIFKRARDEKNADRIAAIAEVMRICDIDPYEGER